METRKVQITGGSTYTVSLPKEWAADNGVEAGSRVAFYREDATLSLTPEPAAERTEGRLDISGLDGDELVRAVVTMYVNGFDVVTLEAPRVTTDKRRTVRAATRSLVSLEVLEETSERVVVRDLLDATELSVHDAITRMHRIATAMLEDALDALFEDDDALARDVAARDDDVDRLWFVVARTFRATLRSPAAAEDLGIVRETCFDVQTSARQLERVADHAAKIAETALELDGAPAGVRESLADLHDEASTVVSTAMAALFADDADEAVDLANEAREAASAVDARTQGVTESLHRLDPEQAQYLGLVVDSLSRSADYGGNIAEAALQSAYPNPEP